MNSKLSIELKAEALRLGFFGCGIARAGAVDNTTKNNFGQWLEAGLQANMGYMAGQQDKRLDPRLLMKGLKSIVCVAMNYAPAQHIPEHEWQLATYAYGEDYHGIVKNKLRALAHQFQFKEVMQHEDQDNDDHDVHYRVFCDTAPILERYWAAQAGLGWIGRNHQLIIPKAGSMFFLGELFLDIDLEYDSPQSNRCGTCHACIEACPTCALSPDGPLDANRCLSYQTIENRYDISPPTIEKMGNTIYGCDKCLEACPWNRFAQPNDLPELQPKPELLQMTKTKWMNLSIDDYQKLFKRSAVKRAKYDGLMRNIRAISSFPRESAKQNTITANGNPLKEQSDQNENDEQS